MKLIAVLFLALPLMSKSQTDTLPKNEAGKYEYTEVVAIDSASADKLYSNAKLFMVDAFKSGKDVTQLNDDNSKTVVGKGNILITFRGISQSAVDKRVNFKVTVQCKDGRYKYTITDFVYQYHYQSMDGSIELENESTILKRYVYKKQYPQLMTQVHDAMILLIHDLKKHMSSQVGATKDW